ncbi:MAG: hypothetical protein ACKVOU_00790 [Cytophagales bacterium]
MQAEDKKLTCEEILAEFKSISSHNCKKDGGCVQYLQLYLDNMACKQKDAEFLQGISDCEKCCEYFQINDCIKNNLKNKAYQLELSDDFVQKIQGSLQKENYYSSR